MQDAGIIFLVLFAVTLFVSYIAIRRAWWPTAMIGSVSAILSVMFVILYALTYEDTPVLQAVFAGLVIGLGFAGAVFAIASFFRANQPPADLQLTRQTPQERNHERDHNSHSPSE